MEDQREDCERPEIVAYQGDSLSGTVFLSQVDPACRARKIAWPIPVAATIEVLFPGLISSSTGLPVSVVLSTANSGEITNVVDAAGSFSYSGAPAKSELLNPGKRQDIDVVVTDTSGNQTTFQLRKVFTVKTRSNP